MVYAQSFAVAIRAADLVKVTWKSGKAIKIGEQDIQNHAAALIAQHQGGALVVDDPGVDEAFSSAKRKIERTYTTGTVMHYALEPVNGLAFQKDGIFEIHTGNQWQSLILPTLAKALGWPQDKIVMRSYLLGGALAAVSTVIMRCRPHSPLRRSAASRSRRFSPAPMTCVLIARALPRNNSFAWLGETMAA